MNLANEPRGFQSFRVAMPLWIKEKLFQKLTLEKAGCGGRSIEEISVLPNGRHKPSRIAEFRLVSGRFSRGPWNVVRF